MSQTVDFQGLARGNLSGEDGEAGTRLRVGKALAAQRREMPTQARVIV